MRTLFNTQILVLTTGTRDAKEAHVPVIADTFHRVLPKLGHPHDLLVTNGNCRGADKLIARLCKDLGFPFRPFPYVSGCGSFGGPLRNRDMVWHALGAKVSGVQVIVLAFPAADRPSDGTRGCMDMARKHGLTVIEQELTIGGSHANVQRVHRERLGRNSPRSRSWG